MSSPARAGSPAHRASPIRYAFADPPEPAPTASWVRSALKTTGECPVPYSHAFPPPQGLYDPRHEHDACGVAFVATLTGVASHEIVRQGIQALLNLDHRGAAGAEPNSGDGAGILLQVPDGFLREVTRDLGFELPAAHSYAVGTAFLPGDAEQVAKPRRRI